jgi:hypothetical protein
MNMRHLLLSILFIFFGSFALAQNAPLKQPMFRDLRVTSTITQTLGDTTLAFHVDASSDELLNPLFNKRYYWFFNGELKSTQGGFTGKLLHGSYEKFDKHGSLVEKGAFNQGLRDGTWLVWHANGVVAEKQVWKLGDRSGEFLQFYSSGVLSKKGYYRQNKLDGTLYQYSEQGNVVSEERYKRGSAVQIKKSKKVISEQVQSPVNQQPVVKSDQTKSDRVSGKEKRKLRRQNQQDKSTDPNKAKTKKKPSSEKGAGSENRKP